MTNCLNEWVLLTTLPCLKYSVSVLLSLLFFPPRFFDSVLVEHCTVMQGAVCGGGTHDGGLNELSLV